MNTPASVDPCTRLALEWLGHYQTELRAAFDLLSNEQKVLLARIHNPHLATGPLELMECTDGIVATIANGIIPYEMKAVVKVPNGPRRSMTEWFNHNADRYFTFMDPVSKLAVKGHKATLGDGVAQEGILFHVIIADSPDRMWLPPCSKVFLIGRNYFNHVNLKESAFAAARETLAHAYGAANLGSKGKAEKLLAEYRALLQSATNESALQTFLEAHPELIYPEHDTVIAKPSLGGERFPDFGFSIKSSSGAQWVFVEIEKPNKKIFRSSDDIQFTSDFTQAKGQLLQWDILLSREHAYFKSRYHGLFKPEFHLVFGRDAELDDERRDMVIAEFATAANRRFSTFDDLANRFEKIIKNVFP